MRQVQEFSNLYIVDHPVIQDKLTTLRNKKTSVQIFADPTKSNFKVTDTKLVNKIGDSRWW